MVEYISDRVAVMYLGKIVELANSNKIYSKALHPYTKSLMSAVPIPDPDNKSNRVILSGDVPSPSNPPSGCSFHPRCDQYMAGKCEVEFPAVSNINERHTVSCFLYS